MSTAKKQLIAVDIDDVTADSTESLRVRVNNEYGVSLTREDYLIPGDFWTYYEQVWAAHDLQYIDESIYHEEMGVDQSHVPLLPGALLALTELQKSYDIVFLTARSSLWKEATERWLRQFFGEDVQLVFGGQKDEVHRSKGVVAKELGARFLIDDNYDNCLSAVEQGVYALLFGNYGWHPKEKTGVVHCEDWQAVLGYFAAKAHEEVSK
jgi:uncharacterized HAD superfamily protein